MPYAVLGARKPGAAIALRANHARSFAWFAQARNGHSQWPLERCMPLAHGHRCDTCVAVTSPVGLEPAQSPQRMQYLLDKPVSAVGKARIDLDEIRARPQRRHCILGAHDTSDADDREAGTQLCP